MKFAIDERDATTTRQYVHRLVEPLVALQQPYRIVTDRYYTSVDTARSLQDKGVFMYGTLRRDRGCPTSLLDDVKARPRHDGEYRWQMAPSRPTPLSLCSAGVSPTRMALFSCRLATKLTAPMFRGVCEALPMWRSQLPRLRLTTINTWASATLPII